MGANLIQSLQEIRDFRAPRGRRYSLWLILLLVVMGTIRGCRSYYALEDFGVRDYQAVSEKLGLKVTRLPSDTTFRRILEKLDFQILAIQFEQWADSNARYRFVNMVSVYSSQQGIVLAAHQFESKHNSELKVVQTMLEALQLEGVVFTMDALHCQKNY